MPRILLVDDNEEFREVVRSYLERQEQGFDIDEVNSAELAIAETMCKKFDVVFMDVQLPRMNGIDAASLIKENNPECDIVIVTMFETEEFKSTYNKGPITAFIGKSDIYDRMMPVLMQCLLEKSRK